MRRLLANPLRLSPWLLASVACAVIASGCASDGWLRISDSEIPLDEPAAKPVYPTAVTTDDEPPPEASPEPDVVDSLQTATKPESPPPLAAIGVLPPSLRTAQPPAPLPLTQVPALTAAPTGPQPLPLADPATADAAPPIVLPGNESSQLQIPPPQEEPLLSTEPQTIAASVQPPVPASTPDRPADLKRLREDLIAHLEDEIRKAKTAASSNSKLVELEQQLRLLYAIDGRLDDAVKGIESLSEPQREAYKHLMFGLVTWLEEDEAHREPARNARVLRSLREATVELSAASKLDLKNLAFCQSVEHFGGFTQFPSNEFQPKQQVILYVEVDNFAATEKGTQFETELQGSYQIFDAAGNVVAERKLLLDRELCRNYRRDYFLAYRIYMPESIPAGRYRLELTIEDLKAAGQFKGRKLGEGIIEFAIRG